jgi:hypothetical protein
MTPSQPNAGPSFLKPAVVAIVLLAAALMGVKSYANHKASKELDSAIASLSAFVNVSYEDVDFGLLSQKLTVSKVNFSPGGLAALDKQGKGGSVRIASISVDDALNLSPDGIGLTVKGVELDPAVLDNESAMKELGIQGPLLLDFGLKIEVDQRDKELNIKNLSVRVQDLASLSIALSIGNVEFTEEMFGKVQQDPGQAMGLLLALAGATLKSAEISYVDESLAQKLMAKAAKEGEVSLEKFKSEWIEKVKASGEESKDEFVKGMVKPLTDFITTPRRISCKAAPKKPVPFGALMGLDSPETVIKTLGVRVE